MACNRVLVSMYFFFSWLNYLDITTTSVKISLGKHQGSVLLIVFVGEHQSRLRVLRPVVLLLACTFHGTIWTELNADPALKNGELICGA